MGFEPELLERIKFHKRSVLLKEITTVLPLVFGVGISVAIIVVAMQQDRFWLYTMLRNVSETAAKATVAGIFALVGIITLGTLVMKLRRERHPFNPAAIYDESELAGFRSALEGVAVAAGASAPQLLVLDLPTANSIAFNLRGEPAIGVTAEALGAGLDPGKKEAMMAHAMAQIALGDYFLASSSARFEAIARGLAVLFFLLAVLAVVVVNPVLLVLLLADVLIFSLITALLRIRKRSGEVQAHNAIIADSLAVKMTMNPAAMREAIGVLDRYARQSGPISTMSGYPLYLFVPVQRSWGILQGFRADDQQAGHVSIQISIPANGGSVEFDEEDAQARSAIGTRVENLQAIETGQASPLEEPLASEKWRTVAGLAVTTAVIAALMLVIVLPWNGKSRVWEFLSTNWILEQVIKAQVDSADRMTANLPAYEGTLEEMRSFLNSKFASGSLDMSISEEVDLSSSATEVMVLADTASAMNVNVRGRFNTIRYFAPDERYVRYSELRTEQVDLEDRYARTAKGFAEEINRLFSGSPVDPAAVAAALQSFEAGRQEILPRLTEVRAQAAQLAQELGL